MNIYNTITAENGRGASFEVLANDRVGLVNDISTAITNVGGDIRSHHAKTFTNAKGEKQSLFKADVLMDMGAADTLLHKLANIKGVVSVTAGDLNIPKGADI